MLHDSKTFVRNPKCQIHMFTDSIYNRMQKFYDNKFKKLPELFPQVLWKKIPYGIFSVRDTVVTVNIV